MNMNWNFYTNSEGGKPPAEKRSDTNKNANIENREIEEGERGEKAGSRASALQKFNWIVIRKCR